MKLLFGQTHAFEQNSIEFFKNLQIQQAEATQGDNEMCLQVWKLKTNWIADLFVIEWQLMLYSSSIRSYLYHSTSVATQKNSCFPRSLDWMCPGHIVAEHLYLITLAKEAVKVLKDEDLTTRSLRSSMSITCPRKSLRCATILFYIACKVLSL